MKAWPLLVLLLSACCPAPLQEQATAFRGVVVGVSPGSVLHLEQAPGTPLLTLAAPNEVLSSSGKLLPLTALRAGDTVYVQGSLRRGELHAELVQQLEP